MKTTLITVPKNIKFMSDVKDIQIIYNNDLPHNAIIDKQVTGVGGTTIALRNKENYVIAVQTIKLVKGKAGSENELGNNVFAFYGEVLDTQLREYLNNGGNKIIVTYDSVPRVASILGEKVSDYRLLVDEYHRMLAYMDNFKVKVCLNLLENTYKFKSVSYMTATPTDLDWLPAPMKNLEYVKFDWEGKTYPDLKHYYAKQNINERVLSIILDKLDNTQEELYIFYNSRKGVASIIKNLLKCRKDLTLDDINILFADTEPNTKYFKQHVNKNFTYGEIPNGTNNKRINFMSSMCYEGTDFFPNNELVEGQCLKTPTTIVVSNPNSITMRFDIQTDLTQIAGRFRRHKLLNKFVSNPIIYVWNTQKVDYIKDKDEYLKELREERDYSIDFLEQAKRNPKINKALKDIVKEGKDKFLINSNLDQGIVDPMLHPYGIEVSMNNFEAFHSVSCVIGNTDDYGNLLENSTVVTKLTSLSPDLSTYIVPELNSKYTKLLGRRPSVDKMLREYRSLVELNFQAYQTDNEELIKVLNDKIESFLQENSEFDEWLDAGVTTSNMYTLGKDRQRINELAETNRKISGHSEALVHTLKLKVGESYSNQELKQSIQEYYDENGINKKAKGTDITQWFVVQKTSKKENGKLIACLKLVSKL